MQRARKRTGTVEPLDRQSAVISLRGKEILRAAFALFVREGGSGFSTRGVAQEAGISLGAVQYTFPTKESLLEGMLEHVLAQYEIDYRRVTDALPFNGEARLLGVVDHLVEDIWRTDTRKFFFNFWALACHNEVAGRLLDATYEHHRKRIAAYVGAARPALSERACLELGLQIAALLDGFMLYTGPGSKLVTRSELSKMARGAVLRLLETPQTGKAPKAGG